MQLSAKTVCNQLGIAADTLRKWEMRYGVVKPERLKNRYRAYSLQDVEKLNFFRKLRDQGWPAGRAAAAVQKMGDSKPAQFTRAQERAWQALQQADYAALTAIFGDLYRRFGIVRSFQEVWQPLLQKVGECDAVKAPAWIAKEHFLSSFLRHLILRSTPLPRRKVPFKIAFCCPEGQLHELGILVASCALWQRGVSNLYWGADLPFNSLVKILQEQPVPNICMALTVPVPRAQLKKMVRTLKRRFPQTQIYFAGSASLPLANLITQVGAVFLGAHMEIGLEVLVEKLGICEAKLR